MLGAIAGDIIGSIYEGNKKKAKYNFQLFGELNRFTDDTVLTVATADSILNNTPFQKSYYDYANKYPSSGFGKNFIDWALSDNPKPYGSMGNGSAMRVSPIGWVVNSLEEARNLAKSSAEVTHNHHEGIRGAGIVACAIYLARTTTSKEQIKDFVSSQNGYEMNFDYDDLVNNYGFDVLCSGSVPQAIFTFLISDSFEDSIRKAVTIGGDSDTITAINGSIAEAYYGFPGNWKEEVYKRLDSDLISVIEKFRNKFIVNYE
jgi:ADP-ribosylglycohydrolase